MHANKSHNVKWFFFVKLCKWFFVDENRLTSRFTNISSLITVERLFSILMFLKSRRYQRWTLSLLGFLIVTLSTSPHLSCRCVRGRVGRTSVVSKAGPPAGPRRAQVAGARIRKLLSFKKNTKYLISNTNACRWVKMCCLRIWVCVFF